jgi:hypothetical protein
MTLLELWVSKEEYKKHDKDIFQGHIFQERSKQKFEKWLKSKNDGRLGPLLDF